MRCLGRTKKLNRCKIECKFILCPIHRFQWIAIFSLVLFVGSFFSDVINPLNDLRKNSRRQKISNYEKINSSNVSKVVYNSDEILYSTIGAAKNEKYLASLNRVYGSEDVVLKISIGIGKGWRHIVTYEESDLNDYDIPYFSELIVDSVYMKTDFIEIADKDYFHVKFFQVSVAFSTTYDILYSTEKKLIYFEYNGAPNAEPESDQRQLDFNSVYKSNYNKFDNPDIWKHFNKTEFTDKSDENLYDIKDESNLDVSWVNNNLKILLNIDQFHGNQLIDTSLKEINFEYTNINLFEQQVASIGEEYENEYYQVKRYFNGPIIAFDKSKRKYFIVLAFKVGSDDGMFASRIYLENMEIRFPWFTVDLDKKRIAKWTILK